MAVLLSCSAGRDCLFQKLLGLYDKLIGLVIKKLLFKAVKQNKEIKINPISCLLFMIINIFVFLFEIIYYLEFKELEIIL